MSYLLSYQCVKYAIIILNLEYLLLLMSFINHLSFKSVSFLYFNIEVIIHSKTLHYDYYFRCQNLFYYLYFDDQRLGYKLVVVKDNQLFEESRYKDQQLFPNVNVIHFIKYYTYFLAALRSLSTFFITSFFIINISIFSLFV